MEPSKSVVAQHIQFFAEANGQITDKSMTSGHSDQGITDGVKIKKWAICNLLDDRKLEHTIQCLARVNNPASSGIWDENGDYDEVRFNKALEFKLKRSDGVEVMTESLFQHFLHELHKKNSTGNATHLGYIVPVSWKAVTDGSINELFRYYSDTTYENEKGKIEKAMTLTKLRQFYKGPNSVMEERIERLMNESLEQPLECETVIFWS